MSQIETITKKIEAVYGDMMSKLQKEIIAVLTNDRKSIQELMSIFNRPHTTIVDNCQRLEAWGLVRAFHQQLTGKGRPKTVYGLNV